MLLAVKVQDFMPVSVPITLVNIENPNISFKKQLK